MRSVAVIAEDDVISDTAEAGSEDGSPGWMTTEVFFDADDSNDAGRDNTAQFEGQFVLTPNGARRDNEANNPTWGENADWFAATTEADGGYQMEFKFSKAALLVSEGDRLGSTSPSTMTTEAGASLSSTGQVLRTWSFPMDPSCWEGRPPAVVEAVRPT